MNVMRIFGVVMLMALVACGSGQPAQRQFGPDGLPLPARYNIAPGDHDAIQLRMLDGVNALRQAAGKPPVAFNAQLNAAAATHAQDMSRQNRPWHFGSDGSSPVDRLKRVGYPGRLVGEVISETFETEMETLAAWTNQSDTKAIILDATAVNLGFEWHQEPNGKIWWVMVLAR